jgi:XTP/dITP diphosphohydrolase
MEIIIATGNKGKFEEIKSALAGRFDRFLSLEDLGAPVEVVEDQPTYLENAWKKARKIGNRFDIDTLADDSGLEVEVLRGRPGICSARYGADDWERLERLLAELKGVPEERRTAFFKAYLVYYLPAAGQTFVFYGSLKGYIGFEARGEKGFGYDPVFMVPGSGRSLAELDLEEKNRVSHRGRALAELKRFLNSSAA